MEKSGSAWDLEPLLSSRQAVLYRRAIEALGAARGDARVRRSCAPAVIHAVQQRLPIDGGGAREGLRRRRTAAGHLARGRAARRDRAHVAAKAVAGMRWPAAR